MTHFKTGCLACIFIMVQPYFKIYDNFSWFCKNIYIISLCSLNVIMYDYSCTPNVMHYLQRAFTQNHLKMLKHKAVAASYLLYMYKFLRDVIFKVSRSTAHLQNFILKISLAKLWLASIKE